jgi:hypothetical protein
MYLIIVSSCQPRPWFEVSENSGEGNKAQEGLGENRHVSPKKKIPSVKAVT